MIRTDGVSLSWAGSTITGFFWIVPLKWLVPFYIALDGWKHPSMMDQFLVASMFVPPSYQEWSAEQCKFKNQVGLANKTIEKEQSSATSDIMKLRILAEERGKAMAISSYQKNVMPHDYTSDAFSRVQPAASDVIKDSQLAGKVINLQTSETSNSIRQHSWINLLSLHFENSHCRHLCLTGIHFQVETLSLLTH